MFNLIYYLIVGAADRRRRLRVLRLQDQGGGRVQPAERPGGRPCCIMLYCIILYNVLHHITQ